MKIITIEEHIQLKTLAVALAKYPSEDALQTSAAGAPGLPYFPDSALYTDIEKRIADMDAHGITRQILSTAVCTQLLPTQKAGAVSAANDELAELVQTHPDRFGAFAALPWQNVEASVKELERAVNRLGFCGVLLAGRASGGDAFLDAPDFLPILEAAAYWRVPIYLHPAPPMSAVRKCYYDGLGDRLSARLALYGWGWHNEAGIQLLRLILSGALDRFPNLQIIAGHWGEMVPFFLSRLDQALPQSVTGLSRTVTDTFREQVFVTPSGIFDLPQLEFCRSVLGADRILYSVDAPFLPNDGAAAFLENAPLTASEKEQIAYQNAEKILKCGKGVR